MNAAGTKTAPAREGGAPRRARLTDAAAKAAAAPPAEGRAGSRILWDAEVPGFGLRVTKAGARAWLLNYRANGRSRQLTIGTFPSWGARQAREEARRLRREVEAGRDPLEARQEARAAPTIAELAGYYLKSHAIRKRAGSRLNDELMLSKYIIPSLGRLKVADVRHADIKRLHAKISERYQTAANRVAALLSKMFAIAIREGLALDNPVKGLERNQETKRERFLNADEIKRLVEVLESDAWRDQPAAFAIMLLLLTGARRGEVLAAQWQQFDLDAGVWTKPSSLTKQKKLHRVPLNAEGLTLLRRLREIADARSLVARAEGRIAPERWLFPGHGTAGHLEGLRRVWDVICKEAALDNVRLHDLRHTYASILVSAGLSLPVIGRLLGHSQTQTTQRYAHLADGTLREATGRVGEIVRFRRDF